jgi:uncharacterized protein
VSPPFEPSTRRSPIGRRRFLAVCGGLILTSSRSRAETAEPSRFFRIATGATTGTYFHLGGLIASAISNPPGSPPCEKGGSCGVPGLIAVAEASAGAVDNLHQLRAGGAEAAFAQSDTAYWALTGSGAFAGEPPFVELRSLGALYTEAIHLVVATDSAIRKPADLRGRVISVGEAASGTLADVAVILEAYGLTDGIMVRNLRLGTAAERLATGEIDGFFIIGGAPLPAVAELAARLPIRLVPFADTRSDELVRQRRFFRPALIADGTYPDVPDTRTLGVSAELVTTAAIDEALIYAVTSALWNDRTRRLLSDSFPRGHAFSP